jgi:hypothetical protein
MRDLVIELLKYIESEIEDKPLSEHGIEYTKIDGEFFESIFSKYCTQALQLDEFNKLKLEDIRGHKFPDFSINHGELKFGVEIKSSERGDWTIPGNSVYENTATTDFDDIFVFFGSYKKEKDAYEVIFTEYWRAVKDIKVTHSPRFNISVNPEIKTDFFPNWQTFVDFKTMKKSEKTEYLQKFLKEQKKGQNLWYVPSEDSERLNPMLFTDLDKHTQDEILTKCYILFASDIFKVKTANNEYGFSMDTYYGNIAKYLLEEHFVINPSIRDRFSSGGWKPIDIYEQDVSLPAIFKNFTNLGQSIYSMLSELDKGNLNDFKEIVIDKWSEFDVEYDNESFLNSYKNHLNHLENAPNLNCLIRKALSVENETHILSSKISS